MGKKTVKYTVVDACTDWPFKGNPAAVCLLEEERDEEWLQSVAHEFNFSNTGYLTRLTDSKSNIQESSDVTIIPNKFRLRWFTPVAENGEARESFVIEMDFPIVPMIEFNCAEEVLSISKALGGASVMEIKKTSADDLFVVLSSGKAVADLQPHFDEIQKCPRRAIIVTGLAAPGSGFNFISRIFGPKLGVSEDPVCGSAHCALAPYWPKKLGKCDFVTYQASPRGGIINLHLDEKNKRVLLRGNVITIMEGSLLC